LLSITSNITQVSADLIGNGSEVFCSYVSLQDMSLSGVSGYVGNNSVIGSNCS
jgi:hypothetical protein